MDDPATHPQLDTEAIRDYIASSVRTWLGLPSSSGALLPQLPDRLARLLLRVEEYENRYRDQWGCWEFGFSENFRAGRLWEPEIDRWAAEERRRLSATVELEPLWPNGHAFAVCLTHDVDLVSLMATPTQVLRSMRAGLSGMPPARGERILRFARPGVRLARSARAGLSLAPRADELELSVQIEREHGVPASYFFTVYPATPGRYDCLYAPADRCSFRGERQRVADVLQLLANEGFDVGLHGSYGSAFDVEALNREKHALERATGLEVKTTRQHFLHWEVRTTPRLHEQAGIAADTTVGFNRNVGFRSGTSLPYHHFDLVEDERLDLLEVPLVIHDGALFRPDALELDRDLAADTVRNLIDTLADTGGIATLLFHPNNLAHPDYAALFRSSIAYGLERNGWFASVRDVDRWWREREERVLSR